MLWLLRCFWVRRRMVWKFVLLSATLFFAAFVGWPGQSCRRDDVLCCIFGRFWLACRLRVGAALSVGYGGDGGCDGYFLVFLPGAATLNEMGQLVFLALVGRFAPAAAEDTRLLVLFEMVQVLCTGCPEARNLTTSTGWCRSSLTTSGSFRARSGTSP